jgi:predicted DNA-binding transcriptional regulator AlpA
VVAILRPKAAAKKLGVSKSTFYEKFVRTGRVRLVKLGPRATGACDDELDAVAEEIRAERDAGPPVCGVPESVGRDVASGRFVSASDKAKETEPA